MRNLLPSDLLDSFISGSEKKKKLFSLKQKEHF